MTTIIRSAIGSMPSTGFLKFLKERNINIIGTDITKDAVGKFLVDKFYEVPRANMQTQLIDKYLDIAKKTKSTFIISGPEEEIITLSANRDIFNNSGITIFHPPIETLEIVTNKKKLHEALKDSDIKTPHTDELLSFESIMTDYIVVKPKLGRGSQGLFIDKKNKIQNKIKDYDIDKYIVQELIIGQEYTVDVLCDMNGNFLNIVPRLRLKTDSGISVISKTVNDIEVIKSTIQLLTKFKFYGGNCFQFIKDAKGDLYLIDINPRFGGGSILSIKSSKNFQNNIINILGGKKTIKYSTKFNELKMYRGYEEYYSI
jgi:carbamoyl-phosphate synthase large subunit